MDVFTDAELKEKISSLENSMVNLLKKLCDEKKKLYEAMHEEEERGKSEMLAPVYITKKLEEHLAECTMDKEIILEVNPHCKLHGHMKHQQLTHQQKDHNNNDNVDNYFNNIYRNLNSRQITHYYEKILDNNIEERNSDQDLMQVLIKEMLLIKDEAPESRPVNIFYDNQAKTFDKDKNEIIPQLNKSFNIRQYPVNHDQTNCANSLEGISPSNENSWPIENKWPQLNTKLEEMDEGELINVIEMLKCSL